MPTRLVELDRIIVEPPAGEAVVNPADWFDGCRGVELEIGCGKGGFLLRRARQHPEVGLVGIEWANKFYKFAADRMARRGMTNVRVMRTDAGHFVRRQLAANCLDAMHIYHPDPWPKKRHHKRRLIQTPFVEAATRALKPGGRLAIQTDHAEYFEQIRTVISQVGEFEEVPFAEAGVATEAGTVETNYEIKYTAAGRSIYRIAAVRCG